MSNRDRVLDFLKSAGIEGATNAEIVSRTGIKPHQQFSRLYRFRIRRQEREAIYIGETENLSQRFSGYRTPGLNQQTNIRINRRLRADLSAGADVAISTITEGAQVECGGRALSVDLSLRAVRRLLENAAILAGHGSDIESLNK
jgi:hypothetical protein